jgi:hypothetical protein
MAKGSTHTSYGETQRNPQAFSLRVERETSIFQVGSLAYGRVTNYRGSTTRDEPTSKEKGPHLMKRVSSIILSILAAVALTIGLSGAASAQSNLVHIGKRAHRSDSHLRVFVRVRVTCSEDTTSASLSGDLSQVTIGGTQYNTGSISGMNSFECTGDEERVLLPIRIPTGGYRWSVGSARVSNICFVTEDPSGTYVDQLSGRTVTVVR